MSDSNSSNSLQGVYESLRRLVTLNIDYAKLTAAEKVSVLMSTVTFYAIAAAIAVLFVLFISFGVGHLLATTVAPEVAYLYIAAFYLVLLILVVVFRKPLIVDPITRFITKLFIDPKE